MCIVRYTAIVYSKSNRVDTLVMHSKYTPRILHYSKTRVHRVEYTLWIILIWHCDVIFYKEVLEEKIYGLSVHVHCTYIGKFRVTKTRIDYSSHLRTDMNPFYGCRLLPYIAHLTKCSCNSKPQMLRSYVQQGEVMEPWRGLKVSLLSTKL